METGGFLPQNHLGNFKKCPCLCPTPRDSDFIGLKSSLGIRIFSCLPAKNLLSEALESGSASLSGTRGSVLGWRLYLTSHNSAPYSWGGSSVEGEVPGLWGADDADSMGTFPRDPNSAGLE